MTNCQENLALQLIEITIFTCGMTAERDAVEIAEQSGKRLTGAEKLLY